MKVQFELDLKTAQALRKKLTLKQNPIWVELRHALDEQEEVCLTCGHECNFNETVCKEIDYSGTMAVAKALGLEDEMADFIKVNFKKKGVKKI